jgi:ABC-type polysaccharide/polyol phosphate export permease
MSVYADLVRYRELFFNLFRRDLHARYRGSVLGVLWSLAYPLVLMGVYVLVFSKIFPVVNIPHYPLYLLSGLTVWIFFSASLQLASRSLVDNANLIKKVRFPRQLVPLSVVGTQLVTYTVMLAVVLAVDAIVIPDTRDTVWLAVPLGALLVPLVAGLALAIAALDVLFRDVEHLLANLLLPWFFLTPILYSPDFLPAGLARHEHAVKIAGYVNFVTPPLEALRDPLFFGRLPDVVDVVYLAVAAAVALGLGALVFSRVDDEIAVSL